VQGRGLSEATENKVRSRAMRLFPAERAGEAPGSLSTAVDPRKLERLPGVARGIVTDPRAGLAAGGDPMSSASWRVPSGCHSLGDMPRGRAGPVQAGGPPSPDL